MKKIFLFLSITVLLGVSFTGCGGTKKEDKKSDVIRRRDVLTEKKNQLQNEVSALRKEDNALKQAERESNIKEVTVTVKVNRKDPNRKDWDYGEKPDIYGLITLKSGDAIAIPLTKNSFIAQGYARDVTINPGDTAFIFLRDQDVDGYQIIENDSFVFPSRIRYYRNKARFTKRLKNSTLTFNIIRKKKK